ncbi:MAG: DNA polymerase IV [Desulfosarcinaceae bacterium]|nr:DNA polymerase IV [Desulfosarcinaceae bacterium]
MGELRKIIHIDMDAFYAAVEQRDNPELQGKPVIVGGSPQGRGVVTTCSYEARRFGVHSAMPAARAIRLCPHAVFVRPRFDVYRSVSRQIRAIFHEHTDLVEPLSLDEAFLDVTANKRAIPSATLIAREILRAIYDRTGRLTASAGVSFNKFIAKVASDYHKPHGITVVTPQQAQAFIAALPIRKFFGVGRVTEEKMHRLGIRSGADLLPYSEEELVRHFGKVGHFYYRIARGRDNRPVQPHWIRKSIGKETTLQADIDDVDQMLAILTALGEKVVAYLEREKRQGHTLTLKVKYHDFQSVTRSVTLPEPVQDLETLLDHLPRLLAATDAGPRKVRLLGISVSNFSDEGGRRVRLRQLPLPLEPPPSASGFRDACPVTADGF